MRGEGRDGPRSQGQDAVSRPGSAVAQAGATARGDRKRPADADTGPSVPPGRLAAPGPARIPQQSPHKKGQKTKGLSGAEAGAIVAGGSTATATGSGALDPQGEPETAPRPRQGVRGE